MKFIGNYSNWIKKEWYNEILSKDGIPMPSINNIDILYSGYKKSIEAGYDITKPFWKKFTKNEVSFDLDTPPWIHGNNFTWWISKTSPGNMLPIHSDSESEEEKRVRRYWIPLQDYEFGHIFVINNIMITNYVAGDVYLFDSYKDLHGSANISYTPRVTLQIWEKF